MPMQDTINEIYRMRQEADDQERRELVVKIKGYSLNMLSISRDKNAPDEEFRKAYLQRCELLRQYRRKYGQKAYEQLRDELDEAHKAYVKQYEAITEPVPRILQIGNLIPDAGRKFTNPQTGRVYDPQGLSPTINTAQGGQREVKIIETTPEGYRIRKLTPRECYRLMGFTDAEFDRIKGVSNTQLYKQAGNSIVVNVLTALFKQLPIG